MSASGVRILGRIARLPLSLVPRDAAVSILHGPNRGKQWIVGSGIHRCWLGFFEPQKQKLISRAIRSDTVFYDVGANVGFYTILGSALVGNGSVFAFEPVPRNINYLRKHIELNHLQNATVLELAVSDANGYSRFVVEETGSMGHVATDGSLEVQTATLDSLVEAGTILPPHGIKMDIEGGEFRALLGAQQCIRTYKPQIFLATHGQQMHEECCQLLRSWGFECQSFGLTEDGSGELIIRPKF